MSIDQARRDDLLIEIGCEELPPKALDTLREAFFSGVLNGLEKHNIEFDSEFSRSFSSPRRLAVLISRVAAAQPDQVQDRRGPAVRAAFDDEGKPTGAALGFARSVGCDVSELETVSNEKGYFELVLNKGESSLEIRMLGYNTVRHQVNNDRVKECETIYLIPGEETLSEVIISSYIVPGIQKLNDGSFTIDFSKFSILPGMVDADVLYSMQFQVIF